MTKKNYLQDRFFVSKRNFTTKQIKIVQKFRIFKNICSKFQVFFKISQIPGFSKFPGFLATL